MKLITMSKQDVADVLQYEEPDFLKQSADYMKIFSPGLNDEAAECAAINMIYERCQEAFRYNEYIDTASKAVKHVKTSSFGNHIRAELANKERHEVYTSKVSSLESSLVELCHKKGLDLKKEETRRRDINRKKKRKTAIILLIICFILLAVVFIGTFICLNNSGITLDAVITSLKDNNGASFGSLIKPLTDSIYFILFLALCYVFIAAIVLFIISMKKFSSSSKKKLMRFSCFFKSELASGTVDPNL